MAYLDNQKPKKNPLIRSKMLRTQQEVVQVVYNSEYSSA